MRICGVKIPGPEDTGGTRRIERTVRLLRLTCGGPSMVREGQGVTSEVILWVC